MANYNTFVAIDCKKRKCLLVTSSARKVNRIFRVGVKIEVWNDNRLSETIYFAKYKEGKKAIFKYISEEKQYIANKQKLAEERNKRRDKANN